MEILGFIFQIGVILAIYNFLWWLIMLGIRLLRGGRPKQLFEVYLIKTVRYIFLADVIFLFCMKRNDSLLNINDIMLAGLILLIYFIGRIQKKQERQSFFKVQSQVNIPGMKEMFKQIRPIFKMKYEILVIVITFIIYTVFYFFPSIAYNNISNWFLEDILKIEEAPVFGFIFKAIGFFFLLSVIFKVVNSFLGIFSGDFFRRNKGEEEDQEDSGNDNNFDYFR